MMKALEILICKCKEDVVSWQMIMFSFTGCFQGTAGQEQNMCGPKQHFNIQE